MVIQNNRYHLAVAVSERKPIALGIVSADAMKIIFEQSRLIRIDQ